MVGKFGKKKTKNRDKEVEPRRSDGCTVKIEKDEMKEEWTTIDLQKLEKLYGPWRMSFIHHSTKKLSLV